MGITGSTYFCFIDLVRYLIRMKSKIHHVISIKLKDIKHDELYDIVTKNKKSQK